MPPPEAARRGISSTVFGIVIAVVFVLAFFVGAFASPTLFPQPEPGTLLVGNNPPFRPFSYLDENNNHVGFIIDLVEEFGKRAGYIIVWSFNPDWDAILFAGETGAIQMIGDAMTITPEREEKYDFSLFWYTANQAVLVHQDSTLTCPDKTCTAADLEGLTWVVQTGTTSNDWVRDNLGEDCQTAGPLFCFDDVPSVINKVKTGGAQAAIMDLPAAVSFAAVPENQIKAIGKIVTGEQYAFAVQEGDPFEILPVLNPILQEMKDDGYLASLEEKWEIPSEIP